MSIFQIVSLSILSGLASVDRLAGLNVMLSRPFVVAGIIGVLFDNVPLCLTMGIIFEFVGMLEVPVGTTIAKDDTFAAYASAVLVSIGAVSNNAISIIFCICITLIFMYPVTLTDWYCRNINRILIITSAFKDKHDQEGSLIKYGLVFAFMRGVIVYNVAVLIIWSFISYIDQFHKTVYLSYVSIGLIIVFLCGYLVRFFAVTNLYKAGLLICGITLGWFLL